MRSTRLVGLAIALAALGSSCSDPTVVATTAVGRVELAPLADVPDGGVLYLPTYGIYLVDSPAEGLIGLWDEDPFRGCRIKYIDAAGAAGDALATQVETRFVDPCHGSQYDSSGWYIEGPSPRSMDRVSLLVRDGRIYIDAIGNIQVPRPNDEETSR